MKLIYTTIFLLSLVYSGDLCAQNYPFVEIVPVDSAMQPYNMYHAGTDSTDVETFTAVDGNGQTFHYGWVDGPNFSDGNVSIDSVSTIGQGNFVNNPVQVQGRTAVIYNSDTIMHMHDNQFFNLGYPSSSDNNFGLVMQSTMRSNGSTFKFTAGITVRDENNFNLKKEYYLHDRSGQISNSSSVTILDSNRIAIVTKGLTHTSSGYYLKLYDSVNVTGHAITGGTEISLANVPYFNATQRAMIIIDMETDSVTGHILDENYFTTKALGNGQYVDLLHHDTTITVNWYSENDTLIHSFVDSLPEVHPISGITTAYSMPSNYQVLVYNGHISILLRRRGITMYVLNEVSNDIEINSIGNFAINNGDYFVMKNDYLFVLTSHEMGFLVDVYDISNGINDFVRHYRNDVAFGSLIVDNLGTPDRFNMDVNGDLVTLSYSVESSIDSYNTSIGDMASFPLYQNRIKSFSFQFTLPDSPLETFEGFDVGFAASAIEYIENDGYHQFTAFVKPGTDLSNLAIDIDFGTGIEEYLFYEDRYYVYSSSIQAILSGQSSDYTTYDGRVLDVRNHPTTIEERYFLLVKYAPDFDGNGISDFSEGINDSLDTDLDGVLDYIDLDNDNDGYTDSVELAEGPPADMNNNDEDGDGIINESHIDDEDSDGSANAFDSVNNIGVDELENSVKLFVSDAVLYIQLNETAMVRIYDINGRLMQSKAGKDIQFPLKPGVYSVDIIGQSIKYTEKVLVPFRD